MKIFGFNITKAEKKPFRVYDNDCRYCPSWEQRNYVLPPDPDMIFGYCSELQQITDNKMKHCKYKV